MIYWIMALAVVKILVCFYVFTRKKPRPAAHRYSVAKIWDSVEASYGD